MGAVPADVPESVDTVSGCGILVDIERGEDRPEMKPLTELLDKDKFLRTLFDSIPCGILVLDKDRRVRAVNNLLERTFGVSSSEVYNKRGGEVLRCVHAHEDPAGCGYSQACEVCGVRNTALKALAGLRVQRQKTEIRLTSGGQSQDLTLLVTAAPVEYEGEQFAVIILEDITELNTLRRRLKTEQSFGGIIGRDPKMLELFDTIREVAEVNVPVLIQGESGTGKELVAAAIHNESPRAQRQFVPVNCGALPDGLLESELFGHVKGAFTGAIRDKKGRFELADSGTIFLDEIGDLSAAMQVKLLRVLQEGTFERVGDEKTVKVDVRVISATNKNLRQEVAAGKFREDLFYRLCVVPITLPPLRDRRTDIPLLAEHILSRAAKESGRKKVSLSPPAIAALMDYPWPGNVRELQNALQYALIKSRGDTITPEHLPAIIYERSELTPAAPRRRKLEPADVANALQQANGNKVKAARLLGVSRATLYRFLSRHQEGNPDS